MDMRVLATLMAALWLSTAATIAQKLGHVNGRELLMALPERVFIEETIQSRASVIEDSLKTMQADYQGRIAEFQQNPNWPDEQKALKYQEILALERSVKEYTLKSEQDLDKSESALMEPLMERVRQAIQEVAKENNFTYIFDSSQGVLLYEGGEDVMPLIKARLGVK